MAITINDNIGVNAPKLLDDRTVRSNGMAYTSKAEVLSSIAASRRALGLVVLINQDLYYFKTGTTLESHLSKLANGDLPQNMVLSVTGDLVDNTDPANPIIVFSPNNYDLSNFTNNSSDKFVRQSALDTKVDKITGRGLSQENYTTTEKTKLSSIEAGAQQNKIDRIYLDGTELPIISKAVFMSSGGDRIVNVGNITLSDDDLIISTGFKWVLNGIYYENSTNWLTTINYTSAVDKKRKDIIVGNQSGTFQRIQGTESDTAPIQPVVPPNTILITTLDVFYDTINNPTPPITDGQYEKKDIYIVNIDDNGILGTDPILADNIKNINLITGFTEDIDGFAENNSGNLYPRMPLVIQNNTGGNINITHLGSGFYKLFFQNEENYILEDKEVLLFYYRDNSSKIFDFVSSNKYTAKYINDKIAEITLEDVRAVDNEVTGNITGTSVFAKTEDEDFLQKKDLDDALDNKLERIYLDGTELPITDKSVFISSTEITHNELSGLQGGKSNEPKEYFHLSESQHERVLDLIYINNSNSFSVNPTSGERGINNSLNLNYNIISNDDVFTAASINQGVGSVLANINTGTNTVSGGTTTQNKTFTLTLNYTRNGVATTETKTATYTTYVPQFAGVSTETDFANLAAIIAASLQKYVQATPAINKQSSPTSQYIWFVSTKNNATILDQNNFSQSVGTWGDGTSEFYRKSLVITLADGTTETVYLYRSRNVKTLSNFTYKIS